MFRLSTPPKFNPHWLARDPRSNRLVLGAELGGEEGFYVLRFDERRRTLGSTSEPWRSLLVEPFNTPGLSRTRRLPESQASGNLKSSLAPPLAPSGISIFCATTALSDLNQRFESPSAIWFSKLPAGTAAG